MKQNQCNDWSHQRPKEDVFYSSYSNTSSLFLAFTVSRLFSMLPEASSTGWWKRKSLFLTIESFFKPINAKNYILCFTYSLFLSLFLHDEGISELFSLPYVSKKMMDTRLLRSVYVCELLASMATDAIQPSTQGSKSHLLTNSDHIRHMENWNTATWSA